MDDFAKDLLNLSESCSIRRLATSGVVSSKPCYVFSIAPCPTDADALYEGAVHNGETASAPILVDIEARYGQNSYRYNVPMYFNKGIYLALTLNMKSIIVQYIEKPRQ